MDALLSFLASADTLRGWAYSDPLTFCAYTAMVAGASFLIGRRCAAGAVSEDGTSRTGRVLLRSALLGPRRARALTDVQRSAIGIALTNGKFLANGAARTDARVLEGLGWLVLVDTAFPVWTYRLPAHVAWRLRRDAGALDALARAANDAPARWGYRDGIQEFER